MVPLILRLRNFMSYGDEPVDLDFAGLHLVCLSGGNGHGKSALLDALTWVLWGRSRARREDDLVRQGATDMEVELTFAEGGARYRVLRKRALRKSGGAASLELHALGDGGYSAVTGATIAETQARLTDILKLSYETFINSSFLLQGRADEFTIKPAAQRKAVLGEILGLAAYDRLAERAKEQARTSGARAATLRADLAVAEQELERRPRLRDDLMALQGEHSAALTALQLAEAVLGEAQAERHRLAAREEELGRVLHAVEALRRETETLQRRRDEAAQAVTAAERLLAREGEITRDAAELRRVRTEIEELRERADQAIVQERLIVSIHRDIEREAGELRSAASAADAEVTKYAGLIGQEPTLRRQVDEHELKEATIPAIESERDALGREIRATQNQIAALGEENDSLTKEMEPLRNRLKLLQEKGAACPVCGAAMAEEDRERVYREFTAEGVAKRERLKDNEGRRAELQVRVVQLENDNKRLGASLAGIHKIGRETARLRQLLDEAARAMQASGDAQARRDGARRILDQENFAHEARQRLADAEAAMQALGYDEVRYRALQHRRDELLPSEPAAAELATAQERYSANAAKVREANEDMARRAADAAGEELRVSALRDALAELPAVEARVAEGELAVQERRRRISTLEQQAAGITELLRVLDQRELALRARRAELASWERENGAYSELGRVFGKDIQTMLIDNALPELEQNANAILTRMSDGTMQVRFDTQRSGSRGDLLETLDIQIADASGTRPYEMFSGGEAFRVNFAIRIALSRLLAERAGAQLQMLVIDEGFGTQDGQGRERLVEAINSIAEDFERIVVITHIEDLKDLFNARIDVTKGRDGSCVTVSAG